MGFDRSQVLTLFGQILRDYEQCVREADQLRHDLEAARHEIAELKAADPATTTLERILTCAQHHAIEIENAAKVDALRLLTDTDARACQMIRDAERHVARLIAKAAGKVAAFDNGMIDCEGTGLSTRVSTADGRAA
jgi:cell division septum initiation protein DivIVA